MACKVTNESSGGPVILEPALTPFLVAAAEATWIAALATLRLVFILLCRSTYWHGSKLGPTADDPAASAGAVHLHMEGIALFFIHDLGWSMLRLHLPSGASGESLLPRIVKS